jgi:hypothetical protein
VQSLFDTYFVGWRARTTRSSTPDHPERFAAYPQISVSRRGRANGPIDVALAATRWSGGWR